MSFNKLQYFYFMLSEIKIWQLVWMNVPLGRNRRGMTHLDADLVDGIAMRSSTGCEGVT
jgi:hypothetical protein